MRLWEEEWKHGNGRKDQLRSDAACSEAPAAGDFYPPPSKLHLSTNDFDICVSPERKVGTTPKRIRKTAQAWIIQEDKTVKEKCPPIESGWGWMQTNMLAAPAWHYTVTFLHSGNILTESHSKETRTPIKQLPGFLSIESDSAGFGWAPFCLKHLEKGLEKATKTGAEAGLPILHVPYFLKR